MVTDTPLNDDDKRTLLRLSRDAIGAYLRNRAIPQYQPSSPATTQPGAAFVTLRARSDGALRGCRGEYVARRPLVESVVRSAVAAATDDPRFDPVGPADLTNTVIEISALSSAQTIEPSDIQIGRHGLIIRQGPAVGLLLPQVATENGWTRDEFLKWLCHKAGLPSDAWSSPDADLQAFESEVWGEE